MKKIFSAVFSGFAAVMLLAAFAQPSSALQLEDENLSVVYKLPPQYLGWKLAVGSTTQTVPFYYKVTAVVPGVSETLPSPVTTAYATYSPLSSTNSIRMLWAPVSGATQYKLYKSVDNSSFYLAAATTLITYLDEGAAVGAAFSQASPRGGNMTVENALIFGGAGKMTPKTKTQIEAITPSQAGEFYACSDCSSAPVCISTGTGISAWVQISSAPLSCN